MSRWVKLWSREKACNLPGTYVIYDDGMPVYIGQSERVRDRLSRGHQIMFGNKLYGVVHLKVRYDVRYGESLMREARLIRKLKPLLNRRGYERARVFRGRQLVRHRPLLPWELENIP